MSLPNFQSSRIDLSDVLPAAVFNQTEMKNWSKISHARHFPIEDHIRNKLNESLSDYNKALQKKCPGDSFKMAEREESALPSPGLVLELHTHDEREGGRYGGAVSMLQIRFFLSSDRTSLICSYDSITTEDFKKRKYNIVLRCVLMGLLHQHLKKILIRDMPIFIQTVNINPISSWTIIKNFNTTLLYEGNCFNADGTACSLYALKKTLGKLKDSGAATLYVDKDTWDKSDRPWSKTDVASLREHTISPEKSSAPTQKALHISYNDLVDYFEVLKNTSGYNRAIGLNHTVDEDNYKNSQVLLKQYYRDASRGHICGNIPTQLPSINVFHEEKRAELTADLQGERLEDLLNRVEAQGVEGEALYNLRHLEEVDAQRQVIALIVDYEISLLPAARPADREVTPVPQWRAPAPTPLPIGTTFSLHNWLLERGLEDKYSAIRSEKDAGQMYAMRREELLGFFKKHGIPSPMDDELVGIILGKTGQVSKRKKRKKRKKKKRSRHLKKKRRSRSMSRCKRRNTRSQRRGSRGKISKRRRRSRSRRRTHRSRRRTHRRTHRRH
jgi:hypothetical protein